MRLRGLGRIKQAGRRLRNRVRPGALILLYHRVTQLATDPQRLAVAPSNFEAQLENIKKAGLVISLNDLTEALRTRRLTPRSIVITFDDGAADNLLAAKPLLEKHDVPAAVFISTGYVKTGREYWWDELDRLLLQPGSLPDKLHLTVGEKTFSSNLGQSSNYTAKDFAEHRGWHVSNSPPPTERHRLYLALIDFLLPLSPDDRLTALDDLKRWSGNNGNTRNSHRALTAGEIKQLSEGGLIEIGAHSVTHSMLSTLPPGVQRMEIQQSKKDLEDILGNRIRSFAYPFGTLSDYTAETVALVKESGFEYACSNFRDVVQPDADLFQLPRVIVRDWGGEEFAKNLESWFRGDFS